MPITIQQIANRFCPVTIQNIIKGAVHAMWVAALFSGGDALLNYAGAIHVDNQFVMAGLAWVVPTTYNAWREYKKGIDPSVIVPTETGTQ